MTDRKILLNPGPATTSEKVKMAQVVPDICPREKEFADLTVSLQKDLKNIIHADESYITVINGGSGTAAMESVLTSVVDSSRKALILINGAYGERFKKISEVYNIQPVSLEYEWGAKIDFDQVESYLINDQSIGYIVMVHHETTTGILNSIAEFSALGQKYNKVLILDAISSYAGLPIDISKTPVNYLIGTSNKCIQGMAGINFVICKKNDLLTLQKISRRNYYLSLFDQYNYFKEYNQFRFTPPVQTMYALRKAVDEFLEEGAENRYDRYKNNYKQLKNSLIELGFDIFTSDCDESNILLTVYEPDNQYYDFNIMHDMLYQKGFTVYPGKVSDKKTFRLSILGDLYESDIKNFINELKLVLDTMNINLKNH